MNRTVSNLVKLIVILGIALGSYSSAMAAGMVYYVSATGNDANACTQSAPCKTITKGVSVAQSGDTVNVSAGVYREYVYVDKSITIISNGATIDGVNASGSVTDGLVSVVASNVKFQGFTISNAKNYGLANFGNNNQIVNNIIHHTQGAGIWMRDGKFNTFDGNELYDTVLQNSVSFDGTYYTCSPTATNWPSAINSWGAAGSNIWRNNNVHDNCGEGMVVYSGDLVENNTFKNNWSIEIYIVAYQTIVRNNTIVDTKPYAPRGSDQSWRSVPAGIAIGDESVCLSDSNTITGNSITGARYGISFYAYISCSGIKNSLIENNTVVNAWEYGLRILTGAHTNSTIRNNTIRLTSGKPLTLQNGGFTVTGNVFFSNVNSFEWNGNSYDFTGWNNVVPGNFWSTSGTVIVTPTPTQAATIPPTLTATSTSVPPTATATLIPPTATPVVPTATATTAPTLAPTMTATFTSIPPTIAVTPTNIAPTTAPIQTQLTPTATATTAPTIIIPTFTPTATNVPIIPASVETTYDDKNKGFTYSTGWKNNLKQVAYDGSYKSTTQNGAYVTFNFTGQSFSVIYRGGVSARRLNVFVDNVLVGTIDESASAVTYQMRWDYPGTLTYGTHTLKMVFDTLNKSNDTNGSFDALIVR